MIRKFFFICFFIIGLTTFSCLSGSSGDGDPVNSPADAGSGSAGEETGAINESPVAEAGQDKEWFVGEVVYLTGNDSFDADGDSLSYAWAFTQYPGNSSPSLSAAAAPDPTFNATLSGAYVVELTVDDGKGGMDTDTVQITVSQTLPATSEFILKSLLYTSHAGIGYMNVETRDDDEPLYGIMFEDLNMLSGKILSDTLQNEVTWSDVLELFVGKALGASYEYTDGDTKFISVIDATITEASIMEGYFDFSGTMSVDFTSSGYEIENRVYFGNSDTDDLVADISGRVTFSYGDFGSTMEIKIKELYLKAKSSLSVLYETGSTTIEVTYGDIGGDEDWEIFYFVDVNWNLFLVPSDNFRTKLINDGYHDLRDYTLGGHFSVDGRKYIFNPGFNYVQIPLVIPPFDFGLGIFFEGALQVPGSDTIVDVSTALKPSDFDLDTILENLEDIEDNISNAVRRDIPPSLFAPVDPETIGVWASGMLTFTPYDGSDIINTKFSTDSQDEGDATFYMEDDSSYPEWTVDNWQDILDPLMP